MWKGLAGISYMEKKLGQGGQGQPLKEAPLLPLRHIAHTQEVLN